MNIHLLRHGQTTQPGKYIGSSDIDLSPTGIEQVVAIARHLAPLRFDRCFCSPLLRCRRTFEWLHLSCECQEVAELKEIDFGAWEGCTYDQVAASRQDELVRWEVEGDRFTFPGGESIASFSQRVNGWFDRLLEQEAEHVLVVSHAGVIRQALCHLLGIGPGHAFRFSIEETCLAVITSSKGFPRLHQLLNGGASWPGSSW